VLHDMKLPLFFIVGVRNYYAHQKKSTADTCPIFTEPIMRAWQIPHDLLDNKSTAADLASLYRKAQAERRCAAVLVAE
jgi:hypothetical protein